MLCKFWMPSSRSLQRRMVYGYSCMYDVHIIKKKFACDILIPIGSSNVIFGITFIIHTIMVLYSTQNRIKKNFARK